MTTGPQRPVPDESEVTLTAVEPDHWKRLRAIRLASLRDSPAMFGSSHDREVELDEAEWRRRAQTATTFVASRQGNDVGLATLVVLGGRAILTSVWADPAYRGQGVVDELCEAVAVQAWRAGHGQIYLGDC